MPRSHLLRLLVLVFLPLTHAISCRPVFHVVLSEQRRYLSLQQRGLPRAFVEPYYKSFLEDLYQFAKKRYRKTSFSKICFTRKDVQDFYGSFHDKSAINKEMKILFLRFRHISYLPNSKERYVAKDDRFEKASWKCFNETFNHLGEREISEAAALPKTAYVLYDPAQKKALHTYNEHISHAPTMDASKLLRVVAGMVITLELKRVSRTSSIQLLRHAVAWLSTVFRALQRDGPDVKVPVLFLPFYKHVLQVLGKQSKLDVPLVPEDVIAEECGDALNAYTQLDAWGRLEILRWTHKGERSEIWTIEKILFEPALLGRVAKKIGFHEYKPAEHVRYDPDNEGADGWHVEMGHGVAPSSNAGTGMDEASKNSSKVSTRFGGGSIMCEVPLYEHVPRAVSTWEEECCAVICCNSWLMLTAGIGTDDCCGYCNQLDCSIEGSPLETLAVVHLEPYGFDMGGAVPVSL